MSCAVDHRRSSDPALGLLWHRLAAAALIGPLAWELPYGIDVALNREKKKDVVHIDNGILLGPKKE